MPGEFLYFQNNNQNIQGKIFLEDIFSKLFYSIGIQIHNSKFGFNCSFSNTMNWFIFIGNCIKINIDSKFAKKSFSKFHNCCNHIHNFISSLIMNSVSQLGSIFYSINRKSKNECYFVFQIQCERIFYNDFII